MPSQNSVELNRVQTLYNRFKERSGGLSPINEAGLRRFSSIGFPGRKAEMFTYVNMAKLGFPAYGERVDTALENGVVRDNIYSGFSKSCVVITNGVYNDTLSDISALSASVTRALATDDDIAGGLNGPLSLNSVENESDPFAALNAAFSQETLIIALSESGKASSRLQILCHSSTGNNESEVTLSPRIFIKIPAETEAEIVFRFTGSGQKCFVNAFQDIWLGKDSTLRYLVDQSNITAHPLFMKSRVTVENGARCFLTEAVSGSRLTRFSNEVVLAGAKAEFEGKAASVITGRDETHIHTTVSHRARDCRSNQYFNNIVLGKGRTSVDTTVEVQKSGGGAESGQLVKNTLLSGGGRADSKPNLRIFADDVKCQHGATTGCLDENQIFYMQSRGVSRGAAENAIISGQVDSMLTAIQIPELRESVRDTLVKKMRFENVSN